MKKTSIILWTLAVIITLIAYYAISKNKYKEVLPEIPTVVQKDQPSSVPVTPCTPNCSKE